MGSELERMAAGVRNLRAEFEDRVASLRPALWRYCLRLTGDAVDAEDLAQETMQRAFSRLSELWQPVDTRAYLFRMASNAWIDTRRREVRAELVDLSEEMIVVDAGGQAQTRIEAHEAIAHLVGVLTPLQRVVFLLCETMDFRAQEVAGLLGTTEGAVKAALHRARRTVSTTPPGMDGRPTVMLDVASAGPLVQRFIAAFDARDPDGIAALMDEHAVTSIVGSAVELGREVARASSLSEWALEPEPQRAVPGLLDGHEVIFVLTEVDRESSLHTVIDMRWDASRIASLRNYYYCPDLLSHAASRLGVPARTHGYRYMPDALTDD